MRVIGTPTRGLSAAEIDCVEDMVRWALSERYRGLRLVIPNDGSCPQNDLLGVPVTRTAVGGGIQLMGRLLFGRECSLCTLHRTPDGPVIEGMLEPAAVTVEPTRSPFPRGIDLRRIPAPRFSIALAGGGSLLAFGVLAGIAPVVATAATSAVQPASMPGLMPDPGPSGWGAVVAHPAIAPAAVPADPDVGGEDSNDGFHEKPGQPGVPDFSRPYDATEGDLKDDHTQAGRGASLDSIIPPAGQGLDAAGGSDGSGNPYAPAQVDPAEVVGGGHKLESRKETREVPAEPEPQEGGVAEVVGDALDDGQEHVHEQDDSEPEVAEVAPEPVPVEEIPAPAPEPEPVPLPAPIVPVTETPPPAPAAPLPVEVAEVAPADSAVTPERPAGVQDPADLREAAGHYRTAADLLEQAADEIEAGDAALAGGSDPEESTGQGGSVDTNTVEDETPAGADADSVDGNDVDRVEIDMSDLKVTVNGEAVAVELGGTIDVEVDAVDDTEVSDVDTARGDATEVPVAA